MQLPLSVSKASGVPIQTQIVEFPMHEANEALAALRGGTISGAAVLTNPPAPG